MAGETRGAVCWRLRWAVCDCSNGLFSVEAAIGAFIYCFELKTTVDVGTTAGTGTGDVKKQSSVVMVQYRSGTLRDLEHEGDSEYPTIVSSTSWAQ